MRFSALAISISRIHSLIISPCAQQFSMFTPQLLKCYALAIHTIIFFHFVKLRTSGNRLAQSAWIRCGWHAVNLLFLRAKLLSPNECAFAWKMIQTETLFCDVMFRVHRLYWISRLLVCLFQWWWHSLVVVLLLCINVCLCKWQAGSADYWVRYEGWLCCNDTTVKIEA